MRSGWRNMDETDWKERNWEDDIEKKKTEKEDEKKRGGKRQMSTVAAQVTLPRECKSRAVVP